MKLFNLTGRKETKKYTPGKVTDAEQLLLIELMCVLLSDWKIHAVSLNLQLAYHQVLLYST